jgi:hypothetical protein
MDGSLASLAIELEGHHYKVIRSIEDASPGTPKECADEIHRRMTEADMIVHLVGDYAPVAKIQDFDIEAEELRVALEESQRQDGPHVFLWRSRTLSPRNAASDWPIQRPCIKTVLEAPASFRYLSTSVLSFPELKADLLKRLKK